MWPLPSIEIEKSESGGMTKAAVRTESTVSSKLFVTSMDCTDCAVKVEKQSNICT